MRFIRKNQIEPQLLTNLKQRLIAEGKKFSFKELINPDKNNFREILIAEQKYLCCYCEQEIENHSLRVVLEHFLPQSKFKVQELDYFNLHLSCTHSNKHCDTVKSDELIVNLLLHPDCASFFKYMPTGEILPNTHEYRSFSDFKANIASLQIRFQAVVHLITVLDLNNLQLVSERKKTFDDLIRVKDTQFDTLDKIEDYLEKENAKANSSRFPSLVEYLLNKQKTKV